MSRSRTTETYLFVVLVVYIFSSFIWWSYLLIDRNRCLFEERKATRIIQYNLENDLPSGSTTYLTTDEFASRKAKYERQRIFILVEGGLFLVLLFFGTWRLRATYRQEVALANQQNNFLLSITHELRSPLASIKLSIQTLLKRAGLEGKYQQLIQNSLDDTARLEELVDNILFAAKMENSSYSFDNSEVDLTELLRNIAERARASQRGELNITTDLEPGIILNADRMALSSAFRNLVENAIKYSPHEKSITIKMYRKPEYVCTEIMDVGMGIPEKEKSKVFDKFYRVGSEETRSTKGTGLGLFIVKSVVENHKGRLNIKDNHPRGTVFQVALPFKGEPYQGPESAAV